MVGQKNIISKIDFMIDQGLLPPFAILLAEDGMGKHTLCNYIADRLKLDITLISNKIDDIKDVIDIADQYNADSYLYVLEDADEGSVSYKNSVLKFIEEPPGNCHILLLASNKELLPATILSRGIIIEFEPYTKEELSSFCKDESVLEITQNPGMLLKISEMDPEYDISSLKVLCETIINKMYKSTLSNSLRIPTKLKYKEKKADEEKKTKEPGGFEPLLFMQTLRWVNSKQREDLKKCLEVENLITEFKNYLTIKSLNDKYTMDEFIIKLYQIYKS